jgi:hypothetical protein
MDYFAELPPELIALITPSLSPRGLSALALACQHLHDIVQPELKAHITPGLRRHLLLEAVSDGDVQTVARLISSPYFAKPDEGYGDRKPLHIATEAGNCEIVALLLDDDADIGAHTWGGLRVLHLAVCNTDLAVVELLLDRGAAIDEAFGDTPHASATSRVRNGAPRDGAAASGPRRRYRVPRHLGNATRLRGTQSKAGGCPISTGQGRQCGSSVELDAVTCSPALRCYGPQGSALAAGRGRGN